MTSLWRHKLNFRNQTKPNAQFNMSLTVPCALILETMFTFLYLESVKLYINWKLNYMPRKWRHCINIIYSTTNLRSWNWRRKTDLSGTVFRFKIDGIVFKLQAKYSTHFLQVADWAKNVLLLLLLDGSPWKFVIIRHETSRVVLPLLLVT